MNFFDAILNDRNQANRRSLINGVVVGIVTNNQDPDGLGRVRVRFPWLSEEDESNWARIASPMAGKERGLFFLPEVEDEVLVAFEHGDPRYPYVVGSLWNGKDKPPASNENGKNNLRLIQSRSGSTIKLNDEDGSETIEILDKEKKNSLVIDTGKNTITITADKDIILLASNGTIKLEAQKIEIKSSADTKIESGTGMDVKASATMNIMGATVNIN